MDSGTYSYRFSGSTMKMGKEFFLVGIGIMVLDEVGNVTGHHTSSILPLVGSNAAIQVARFQLTGTYGVRAGGFGQHDLEASITFTEVVQNPNDPAQVLIGTFAMVPAGALNRLWLISTGAFNQTENSEAHELVTGEAIRIS